MVVEKVRDRVAGIAPAGGQDFVFRPVADARLSLGFLGRVDTVSIDFEGDEDRPGRPWGRDRRLPEPTGAGGRCQDEGKDDPLDTHPSLGWKESRSPSCTHLDKWPTAI